MKNNENVGLTYTTMDLGLIFFYSFLALVIIITCVIPISIEVTLFIEILSTTLMAFLVLKPFTYAFCSEKIREKFYLILITKIIITIILYLFLSLKLAFIIDLGLVCFFSLILTNITHVMVKISFSEIISLDGVNGKNLKCLNCGSSISKKESTCHTCGSPCYISKVTTNSSDFDPIYNNSEEKLLEKYIERELVKTNISNKMIPKKDLIRLNVLSFIFSILLFIYISLLFLHWPTYTYVIGLIILIIFFRITRSYNLIKYLKKEIKAKPNEKIHDILMKTKNDLVLDSNRIIRLVFIILAIILPLIIFYKKI